MNMKVLQIDEALYDYIARQTQQIGESASDILRRLLKIAPDGEAGKVETPMIHRQPHRQSPSDTHQPLHQLLSSVRYRRQKKSVGRFMLVLSTLYAADPAAFSLATATAQGRTRLYFAREQRILLQSGKHSKPQAVPESPYWVITNTNSARKRIILQRLMSAMRYPAFLIEAVGVSL